MTFHSAITAELERLKGLAATQPYVASFPGSDGLELRIGFTAVDSLSCSFAELNLTVPALAGCSFDVLEAWAEALARKVTYLLEDLGPLERDPQSGRLLMRSTEPDARDGEKAYYEVLLESQGQGAFSLRRYRSKAGEPGRQAVDLQVTHEVLLRLADDFVETIPETN